MPVPDEDTWRLPYAWRLLEHYSGNTEEEEIVQSLLDSLVKN